MRIYPYPSPLTEKRIQAITGRGLQYMKRDITRISRIIQDVKKNGDEALIRYIRRFDSPRFTIEELRVSNQEFRDAKSVVPESFMKSLSRAADQIESFHRRQKSASWITTERDGIILGQMIRPIDRAGIYVPGGAGGATPLVSSVLMGALPARIAGVKDIVMITPSTKTGAVNPFLLAAARIAGVRAVFKTGSAWGIAALAFGTETVPKVDIIAGPGNIHVTLAKKILAGEVGIDMIAGPSEILILADDTANPSYAAADLLSQAEHDPLAAAVMITDSKDVALSTREALAEQIRYLNREDIARKALSRYGMIILVPHLDAAFDLANRIAPEHLELLVKEPMTWLGRIRNAGAVFVGPYSPEPIGDYLAGPNHILPTAGTARFSSALSVDHFVKKTSLIYYSKDAFLKEAPDVIRLAEVEGLGAHARSISVRLGGKP
ncbi:MAG: histidinol dehydrogenase [Thermodesulfobacteriota bacterium]